MSGVMICCPKCGSTQIDEVCQAFVRFPVLAWEVPGEFRDATPTVYGDMYLDEDSIEPCDFPFTCRACHFEFGAPAVTGVDDD